MNEHIRTAAVLGAGNMGAQIAAHLANAGLRVHLLDRIPSAPTAEEMAKGLTLEDASVRNRLAKDGLQRQSKARPAAFFLPEFAARIEIGNFEDHLDAIAGADWIIEAVLEDLEVKRALFSRIDRLRRPETLVSSNTSGLSVRAMSEGCSEDFQRHFMGTHFFNPVRYMKLVEIIPTPKTNPSALSLLENFCDLRLGKGVVLAKDTPNFIANRIGTFAALFTLHHMIREGYSIEEVDLLTGPAVGHPKMASFRLADLVGVDVLAHVAKTLYESALDDESKEIFRPPEFLNDMLAKNWLGNKTGGGFYKKIKENGKSVILTLDIPKMEYRHRVKPAFPSVDAALSIENTAERVRRLISSHDRAGAFIWQVTSATLAYAADKITEISDDIVNVDRAMNWGYNWEMGPFRTWDAIGVRAVADRMQKEGREVPSRIEQFLSAGHQSFYQFQAGSRQYFDFQSDSYKNLVDLPGVILLPSLKDRKRTITSNPGATLLDLGDGVACLEFHSKMNAVGNDAIEMMRAALREVGARFEGLVIGNQAENFSVGANIMLLLLEAQEENWEEIDFMIRTFQDTVMSLRYSAKPVVAAPFGMALGGGCEVCLGSDRIRAAAETYMGLVEVGVGLIPGGGGCKEMVRRAMESAPADSEIDFTPHVKRVFETIGMAKYSTSAAEARRMGFLMPADTVTINRDRLIQDAKTTLLEMVREGYCQPERRDDLIALGEPTLALLKLGLHQMVRGGFISEYDAHVGRKLAEVLTGGSRAARSRVSEQHFLDLEREAFLSLCGEPKTQERIQHMLKNGKPLRN